MSKQLFIDPTEVRKSGWITFKDIPVNQYSKTIEDEKANFLKEDFLRIYRDMAIIREFETMLYTLRTANEYEGIPYKYSGPAHLSIGQEASAVGQAYILDKDDFIFGSHRSHGEIIAKAMSCIQKMSDQELLEIMENTFEGSILKTVEEKQKDINNVKELAIEFFIYGAMAEIFGRENGFAKGLGNSMHVFFTPFGIYPNNAIVGGSAPIALGAALYKKINKKKGVIIANMGDGAIGCGPVLEAMNMSAMDQFKTLWEEGYKGGLPIIFNFFNNQYGMGGQTNGETMGYQMLARIGAGINPEQMHAERIDGYNPLAVIDAVKRKKKIVEEKQGPVLLDTVTYRLTGHSPSDAETYRTKEEFEAWKAIDPLETFKNDLIKAGIALETEINKIRQNSKELILNIFKLAVDEEISPRMDLIKDTNAIGNLMFSNKKNEKMDERECEVLIPKEENPRVKQIRNKI